MNLSAMLKSYSESLIGGAALAHAVLRCWFRLIVLWMDGWMDDSAYTVLGVQD